MEPWLIALAGGLLPFGSIFIEMYFVFTSFWAYKIYFVYGFMLLVLAILAVVTVCVTIVCCYLLLNSEARDVASRPPAHAAQDYRWHWTSFCSAASTGVYVYAYSVYYYFFKTKMFGTFQTTFFFGYSALFAIVLGVMCGVSALPHPPNSFPTQARSGTWARRSLSERSTAWSSSTNTRTATPFIATSAWHQRKHSCAPHRYCASQRKPAQHYPSHVVRVPQTLAVALLALHGAHEQLDGARAQIFPRHRPLARGLHEASVIKYSTCKHAPVRAGPARRGARLRRRRLRFVSRRTHPVQVPRRGCRSCCPGRGWARP